ncbi:MAG: hypothetical protein WBM04_07785 [Candidatus Korobacteraceae bacterium]
MKLAVFQFVFALALTGAAAAQTSPPPPRPSDRSSQSVATKPGAATAVTTTAVSTKDTKEKNRQKFVEDVVHSAVALPQPDPQDRLRVLYAAANVVSPIDAKEAQQFAREGIRIETELVTQGEKPAVSMLAGGHVDCASAVTFVQTIPPAAVLDAEQSLLGAITMCPKQVAEPAKRKLEAGVQQGTVAARPILALMDAEGAKSAWSQAMFTKVFASLPADASSFASEAPNYAAMFVREAPEMELDAVKTAGLKFLLWLAKVPDSPERNVAVNMVTGSLNNVLGKDAYQELLRSDIMAQQVANSAGTETSSLPPEEESVSVLRAMGNKGDRTDQLNSMPPSLRAREAAASGFASGTSGDRKLADHYFDIAFSSLDEVWSDRASLKMSAPAVVEEVSQAAAQVDPVEALQRSQRLQDPSAEAISMLAVAQVVVGRP